MKAYAYRTEDYVLEKLKSISKEENRSINQEIVYIVRKYIIEYEMSRQEHKQ